MVRINNAVRVSDKSDIKIKSSACKDISNSILVWDHLNLFVLKLIDAIMTALNDTSYSSFKATADTESVEANNVTDSNDTASSK